MLNLIKNGEVIRHVAEGSAVHVDDVYVSPAEAGWSHGEYELVEAAPEPEPEPMPPTVEEYRAAIQDMLDDAARAKLYDNGLSLSTYVNSTNAQWAAEAAAFVAWRDAVWAYAYTELAKVEAELRSIPTVEDFLAELPEITWPEAE